MALAPNLCLPALHRLLSRFSIDSNEYVPSFYEKQEIAEKLQKPIMLGKRSIHTRTYVFRGLRVKEPLMN